jgi:hypothetical protein
MSISEAKALGLLLYRGTDGLIGLDSSAFWTFNPNARSVGGEFDFIGVAEHEISEVLGASPISARSAGHWIRSICFAIRRRACGLLFQAGPIFFDQRREHQSRHL